MTLAPHFSKAVFISLVQMGFRIKIMKDHKNIVLCGYPVQFLLILENFCINRKLNFKKVSLYKPPLTPFWPCPAKQQGIFLSFHLRGKTNRQMLCIKGGRKGDKNWRKHVRARYCPLHLRPTIYMASCFPLTNILGRSYNANGYICFFCCYYYINMYYYCE